MTGRWAGHLELVQTPQRSSGRGWTIAGLLLVAAGIGYVVLRPRVYTQPDGSRAITIEPPVRGPERAIAAVAPIGG